MHTDGREQGSSLRDLLLQLLKHAVQVAKEALTTNGVKHERLVNEASEASALHRETEGTLAKARAEIEKLLSARTQTDKVGAWSMRAPGRAQRRLACVVQAAGEQQQRINALQQQVGRRLYSGLIFVHSKPLLVITP